MLKIVDMVERQFTTWLVGIGLKVWLTGMNMIWKAISKSESNPVYPKDTLKMILIEKQLWLNINQAVIGQL